MGGSIETEGRGVVVVESELGDARNAETLSTALPLAANSLCAPPPTVICRMCGCQWMGGGRHLFKIASDLRKRAAALRSREADFPENAGD